MEESLKEACEKIQQSNHTVAFTGAGISVESGVPPFRGENGLWNKYDPSVLDLNTFLKNPSKSWKVIKEIFYTHFGKVVPNKAHEVLSKMEQAELLHSVITQNIDNLHQRAGSKHVIEFHGTSQSVVCLSCHQIFDIGEINLTQETPTCQKCGGQLKPNFIFFGEGIPEPAATNAFEEANKARVMLVIGTTGEVMPASYIPMKAKENGATIIEINPNPSTYTSNITDIFLKGTAGEVFEKLSALLF